MPRPTSMPARSRSTKKPRRPTTAAAMHPIRTSPTSTRCSRGSAPVTRRPRPAPRPRRRRRDGRAQRRAARRGGRRLRGPPPSRTRGRAAGSRRPRPAPGADQDRANHERGRRVAGAAGRGPRSAAGLGCQAGQAGRAGRSERAPRRGPAPQGPADRRAGARPEADLLTAWVDGAARGDRRRVRRRPDRGRR